MARIVVAEPASNDLAHIFGDLAAKAGSPTAARFRHHFSALFAPR